MATDTRRIAKIMKALSNENRLGLYLEIAKHQESDFADPGCFVTEIMEFFKLSAPTISHHLKELANAELITTERRGKLLVARINKETVGEVQEVLAIVQRA
jgi:DNA-binding transcriptional ArsR family regulator